MFKSTAPTSHPTFFKASSDPVSRISSAFFLAFTMFIIFAQIDSAFVVAGGEWYTQGTNLGGIRILKDALPILFYFAIFLHPRIIAAPTIVAFALLAFYNTICALLSDHMGYSIYFNVAALRYLMYLPILILCLSGGIEFSRSHKQLLLCCRLFIAVESCLAIAQLFFLPPVYGATMWGPKVIGTFENPNFFGQVLSLYLFIYFVIKKKFDRYFVVATIALVLSGSRMAILCPIFIILFTAARAFRIRGFVSYLFLSLLIFVMIFLLSAFFSQERFSGRDFDDPFVRYNFWLNAIEPFKDGLDLAFGVRPGMYSNSAITLFKSVVTDSQFVITDSTLIFIVGAFGLFGLLLLTLTIVTSAIQGRKMKKYRLTSGFIVILIYVLLLVGITNVTESLYLMWPVSVLLNILLWAPKVMAAQNSQKGQSSYGSSPV